MPWKPNKGWMTPKDDNCVNCCKYVEKMGPGYLVWDGDTGQYKRQHVECKEEEDKERNMHLFPPSPPSESPQAA